MVFVHLLFNCKCSNGYYGTICDLFDCFGVEHSNSSIVCSGNGICQTPDFCKCNNDRHGIQCEAVGKCVTVNNSTLCAKSSTHSFDIHVIFMVVLLVALFLTHNSL
ncbi:predicted protein [Naegleria gruberi]|uniref:Predicted protein n=1 Tax=Naegleria gruberi TaxID=5762 RepID=D2VIV2_NAEGR|nr:uncharacterized protein NAEGRDRAFT_68811 [Naegleria gruberi]EFC43338.1 predicted protein [Naegleria gruberi]|eukprot:XP_002676082.1 predicted protein [Naegleria gruberi strain NEG-M]